MGIILIFTLLLTIGIIWSCCQDDYDSGLAPIFFISMGAFGLFLSGLIILTTISKSPSIHIQYYNDKEYIGQALVNVNITDNERTKVTQLIIDDNNIIKICQYWRGSFWVNWFYPNLDDLKPFEQRIPPAKTQIQLSN